MDRLKVAAIGAALVALASPALAGWTIDTNEPDPFEPSKSRFIAGTVDDHVGLAIRCLDGGLSLVVATSASNAATGDLAHLKIVADGKPPRDQDEAYVISSTADLTVVQFGDEATVVYLKGTKKVSVRYELGGARLTNTFGGGKSLDDIIQKALKACGKSALIEPPQCQRPRSREAPSGSARRMPAPTRTTSSPTRRTSGPASRSERLAPLPYLP
jgi:hypothetical protein